MSVANLSGGFELSFERVSIWPETGLETISPFRATRLSPSPSRLCSWVEVVPVWGRSGPVVPAMANSNPHFGRTRRVAGMRGKWWG